MERPNQPSTKMKRKMHKKYQKPTVRKNKIDLDKKTNTQKTRKAKLNQEQLHKKQAGYTKTDSSNNVCSISVMFKW